MFRVRRFESKHFPKVLLKKSFPYQNQYFYLTRNELIHVFIPKLHKIHFQIHGLVPRVSRFTANQFAKISTSKSFCKIFITSTSLQMFLQKQTFYQRLFTKQIAWLARAWSTDSIDIMFANFGRVDQKLQGFQICKQIWF